MSERGHLISSQSPIIYRQRGRRRSPSRDGGGLGIPGEGGFCRQRERAFQQPGERDSVVGFRIGEVGEARQAAQPWWGRLQTAVQVGR